MEVVLFTKCATTYDTLGLSKAERSKGPIVRDVPLDLSPLRIPAM